MKTSNYTYTNQSEAVRYGGETTSTKISLEKEKLLVPIANSD